jgi:hypothetical protein
MCRVEERIYIRADGHRSKFEEAYLCDKSRKGKLCAKVQKRTTEYYPKNGVAARNDTPSPIHPSTPTGTGSYVVQHIRPTSSSGRPSTRDGQKASKPDIIIEFGSKREGSKKYPSISVSTKAQKRSSFGGSVASNEVVIDSPGSDASHTIRTGFPEAPLPPQTGVYGATPTTPRSYHHRQTSSTSSYTGSSRTPSLYVTSDPDYDSPTNSRTTRIQPAIVHNPSTVGAPSSPRRPQSQAGNFSNAYNTTVITPNGYTQETHTPDGLFPLHYPEYADRSASSHASSGASGKSRQGRDQDQPRHKREDDRRRQEELDRQLAEAVAKEENVKQVRFELGRAEGRAKERAENIIAQKDKQRAEDREDARRRKDQERDEMAARERRKEKTRAPTTDFSNKHTGGTRRGSMTQAQIEEQERLLAADVAHMQGESQAAEARDREERAVLLRQQQQDPNYYNPRAVNPTRSDAPVTRRNSVTRRGSVSSAAPPMALGRSDSNRRPNVIQPNPPALNTQLPQNYSRPPSARTHAPPPVSFPASFNTRPTSARRPSLTSQENPFASPPTRGSGPSFDNPFVAAPSVLSPSSATIHQDPWDARTLRDALPTATRQTSDGRYSTQRRGGDVANTARQATRTMGRAAGYGDDYAIDSDEETHGYARIRR